MGGAPDDYLENTKLKLYKDQVFCFTPKGRLIQLPRGRRRWTSPMQCAPGGLVVKVNGRLLPLRHQLQTAMVEIMTARGARGARAQWERS